MPRLVRTLLALALTLVAAVLVVTFRARGWPVVPDLVLLPVVALALSRGWLAGALLGLAAGWVVDLVPPGGDPLGLTPLLYAVAGSLAVIAMTLLLRRMGLAGRIGLVVIALSVLLVAVVPVVGAPPIVPLLLGAIVGIAIIRTARSAG